MAVSSWNASNCPDCRGKLTDNPSFCPHCGTALSFRDPRPRRHDLLPWFLIGSVGFASLLLIGFVVGLVLWVRSAFTTPDPAAQVDPARNPVGKKRAGEGNLVAPDRMPMPGPVGMARPPASNLPLPADTRTHRLSLRHVEVAQRKADGRHWDFELTLVHTAPDPFVQVIRSDVILQQYVSERLKELSWFLRQQEDAQVLTNLEQKLATLPPDDPKRANVQAEVERLRKRMQLLLPEDLERMEQLRGELVAARKMFDHLTPTANNAFRAEYNEDAISVSVGDTVKFGVYDRDLVLNDHIGETTLTITEQHLNEGRAVLKFQQVLELLVEFRKR